MWKRCPDCFAKYRDIRADGVRTPHACARVEYAIVVRAGETIEIPASLIQPGDTIVHRAMITVAETDGVTTAHKHILADVAPATSPAAPRATPRRSARRVKPKKSTRRR